MTSRETFEYPYKKVTASEPSASDGASIQRGDSNSGSGTAPRALPKAFEDRQRKSNLDEPQIADALTQRFIYAHAERRASSRTVLDEVASRAKRAPSRKNLERMQAVANEIGRRRGGGKLLREVVTQVLVDQLTEEA